METMMESSVDVKKKKKKKKQLPTTTWNLGCNYVQVNASEARFRYFFMKKQKITWHSSTNVSVVFLPVCPG